MDKIDIKARLMADLLQRGFTRVAASAIVGNLAHETDDFKAMRPYNKSENSYGYAHWNGPRRKALFDYAASQGVDPGSYEANFGYLMKELDEGKHVSPQLKAQLNQAKTVEEAARLFSDKFERPGVPAYQSRIAKSQSAYGIEPQQYTGAALEVPTTQQEPMPTPRYAPVFPSRQGIPTLAGVDGQKRPLTQFELAMDEAERAARGVFGGKGKTLDQSTSNTLPPPPNLPLPNPPPPGYGDMGMAKTGFAAVQEPDYKDLSQLGMGGIQSIMQLILGMKGRRR